MSDTDTRLKELELKIGMIGPDLLARCKGTYDEMYELLDSIETKNSAALIQTIGKAVNDVELLRAELREVKKMLGAQINENNENDAKTQMRTALETAGESEEVIEMILKAKFGNS